MVIRPDFKDGFILPYHAAIEKSTKDPEFDPAQLAAFSPEDRLLEFSHASQHVTHDGAIASLLACAESLRLAKQSLAGPWDRCLEWLDHRIGELWKARGPWDLVVIDEAHKLRNAYWDTVFANNITSLFLSMRAELRQMLAQGQGGAIVNIGSIAGLTGLPGNPAYSASKHAVIGLTRNAAIDYAPHGIRVNSVNMAQTDTPMVTRAYEFVKWMMEQGGGSSMAGAKSQSLLQIADPNKRGSTPWEQAAIILFLLSPEASNLTGLAMATDGGWTAY
ncbi:MAG: SDR family oxidoreductase [Planctomycetota bacterium]|jgi:NAD(P)-dependent dehydrogenase (short-subunit alcohol dehydrogenase family)